MPTAIRPQNLNFPKSYEPQQFEKALYEFWESQGCFKSADENAPGQKSFCIVIPPPNVTGVLHMGHALTDTIEDILTRWRRMHGDNTLWLPGTDHAGIATQAQVEKQIAKEGKNPQGKPLTRHDLGRAKFLERTWKWKEDHHHIISGQTRRMGASLDWSRERFTMDEGFTRAVTEVFVRLYEDGLMYRGERIINWCPRCQTALSDLEVVPTDRASHIWHIQYQIEGSKETLTIATTRPETLLGDTAVAVHPEDERYQKLKGKKAILPLLGRKIPIIQDEYVDREFGTGALKVTPAHDFNDYDLGQKHKLESISVMGKDGRITSEGGPYAGLKFDEARAKILEDLKASGQLLKEEPHALKVGLCQRCDRVAEPIVSKQWFVKTKPLASEAIKAVEDGRIEFSPKTWEKTYFEWMHNIRDWCVSRQLWWGHQIPAWYCSGCEGVTVARETPKACSQCKKTPPQVTLTRDEDVLDTWFSSALWPFATLGWPEQTKALKTFYPNAILETGFDIIFFWVSRMIMMGLHFMKDVPFRKVYLHAMVRDEKGEKMSKSKGNVIDPLVIVDQHGADPLRFTFATMAGQGRDIKLNVDRVAGYRAFCNKLWNATKFFHLQLEAGAPEKVPDDIPAYLLKERSKLNDVNRWILSEFQKTVATVEKGLQNFEIDVSAKALYDFGWLEFCDWYIECSKLSMDKGSVDRDSTLLTFHYVLEGILKLLHPFAPFVTEALWQQLPWARTDAKGAGSKIHSLMLQKFPVSDPRFADREAESALRNLKSIVEAIRNFRGENGIPPKKEFAVGFVTKIAPTVSFVKLHQELIVGLSKISSLELQSAAKVSDRQSVIPITQPPMDLVIDLSGLVDVEEERKRLKKEIDKVEDDIAHLEKKLSNESFVARAPKDLVEKEKQKIKELQKKRDELLATLKRL